MRRCKGPSHLGPGEHRGNVGVTPFILVKPKTVSLHRDVTLKSTTHFSYGGFLRITAPQYSVIPEESIFFPQEAKKGILQRMVQTFPQLMAVRTASVL